MILAIDVGNSNIVIGGYENDTLSFTTRVKTDKFKMSDEYAILFKQIIEFNNHTITDIEGVAISTVVPSLLTEIKMAIEKLSKSPKIVVVSPGAKTGLNIIGNANAVGADLVCGAVGAIAKYKMPCIVIDLGTATKFTVLDETGKFIGVSILPGVRISLNALSKEASLLPYIDFDEAQKVIGTTTVESMLSGVVYGTASMVDGMIERIVDELGQSATAVITGGLTDCVAKHCKSEIIRDDNLILDGLMQIYKKNI